MVQNAGLPQKNEGEGKPDKDKGLFKKLLLGGLGIGGLLYLKNKKNIEKENIKHKIEMVELKQKLPFYERYKWTTRIALIALIGSFYRCNDQYRALGKGVIDAFRETRKTVELQVKDHQYQLMIENNKWKNKFYQNQEETKKVLQKVNKEFQTKTKKIYDLENKLREQDQKLSLTYQKLIQLTKYQFDQPSFETARARVAKTVANQYGRFAKNNQGAANTVNPSNVNPSNGSATSQNYFVVVKRGDCLWRIIEKTYENKISVNRDLCERIADYNHLENMNLIEVGQVLKLPKNPRVLYKK